MPRHDVDTLLQSYAQALKDEAAHKTPEAYESHVSWHEHWNSKQSRISKLRRALVPDLTELGATTREMAITFGGFRYWAADWSVYREPV